MTEEQKISFKEMCAKFDVTPRTLRYYEYIELLKPHKDGRSRHYGAREIARMTLIRRGRRFGFSLEDIRQWLLMYEQKGSVEQFEAWLELSNNQLKNLEDQISELQTIRAELEELRDATAKELKQMK